MGTQSTWGVKAEAKMRVLYFLSFLICLASCKYYLVKTKGKAEGLTSDGHKWEGSNGKESGKDYTDTEDSSKGERSKSSGYPAASGEVPNSGKDYWRGNPLYSIEVI